jgi:hypothetical protein
MYSPAFTAAKEVHSIMKAVIFGLLFAGLAGLYVKPSEIKVPEAPVAKVVNFQAIELPEDGQKYYTTLCLPDNWKEREGCRKLVSWFETDPRLAGLKNSTHFAIYTESDVLFRERYAAAVGPTPCVFVNAANGKTLYATHVIPESGAALADEIASRPAGGWRRDRRRQGVWNPNCPNGNPFCKPEVPEAPEPAPVAPVAPVEVIPDTPKHDWWALLIVIVAGVVGAALGVADEFGKEKKNYAS